MTNIILSLLGAISSNTALKILLAVLIVLIVLISALAVVFIVALRKRAPVIKVIMAPPAVSELKQTASEQQSARETEQESETSEADSETELELEDEAETDKDDDEESVSFVTEGEERVRYDRSLNAKLIQLKDDVKEWYSQLKNELLSYGKVRSRMSWKRESFRIGRATFARITVRGRTLCLMLAVDPSGFAGTKFSVEDVSNVASTSDTPCLYRIKSGRRIKYAKELIAAVMHELGVKKQPDYEPQDFYMPYAGDVALMERGLIKRVVYGSTRTYEIRETDRAAVAASSAAETENVGG